MKSIRHTKSFEMDLPIAELFPLFSPEGEKRWVPGWDYENLMGKTELSEDDVFPTEEDSLQLAAGNLQSFHSAAGQARTSPADSWGL